jgi:hypothetical protein
MASFVRTRNSSHETEGRIIAVLDVKFFVEMHAIALSLSRKHCRVLLHVSNAIKVSQIMQNLHQRSP